MKSVIAFCAALLVGSVALSAEITPSVEKMLEGSTAYCVAKEDVGTSAYVPRHVAVTAGKDQVEMRMTIAHLICVKSGNNYYWQSRRAMAPITRLGRDGKPVTIRFSKSELVLMEHVEQKSGETKNPEISMPMRNMSQQTVVNRKPIHGLDINRVSKTRYDLYTRSIVTYERDGKVIDTARMGSGAYHMSYELAQENGAWVVRNLEIR